MRALRALLPLLLLACDGTDEIGPGPDPRTNVDLDALFAPPTESEIGAVEAEWASRNPVAEDVEVLVDDNFSIGDVSHRLRIVSHVVADGGRHYGAVLAPTIAEPGTVPLLVYAHGGDQGTSIEELALAILTLGLDIPAVWVVPSFRSETLRYGPQSWTSDGPPSPWDRDVDDALALLEAAISITPAADPEHRLVAGISRGGGVALLMGARDPRIDAIVEFFGPTDFFDDWMREILVDAFDGDLRDLPGLDHLNGLLIQPLRDGQLGIPAMRHEMLLRSPRWFAARLPRVQVHHGSADPVVAVSQTLRLGEAMALIGRDDPLFRAYLYPGGVHNPITLPGALDRAATFLRLAPAALPQRN